MYKVRPKLARSLDRSSSSEIYTTSRSRSASESRLRSQYDSELSPSKSITSSLEVHLSRETVKYNGICKVPDYYSTVLGPTVDESILVGLQMVIDMGFALPNCTEPPPKYELPSLESSSDFASQTQPSETKSETSQTTESVNISTPSSEVPIGQSKETYNHDYEESLLTSIPSEESDTPEPAESLGTPSAVITSEEILTDEPSKTETIVISDPKEEISIEPTVIDSDELSTYDLEKLFEEENEEMLVPEPEVIEEPTLEKIEEEIIETPIITEEELLTEDDSTDDIMRLTKSQDDSKTSQIPTLETPERGSSFIINRNYRSKFPNEIIVATATHTQDDQPALDTKESTRSRASVKSSKNSNMSETNSKKSADSKKSRRGSNESKQPLLEEDSTIKKSSRRDTNESTETKRSRRDSNESKKTELNDDSDKKRRHGDELKSSSKDSESRKEKYDSRSKERRSSLEKTEPPTSIQEERPLEKFSSKRSGDRSSKEMRASDKIRHKQETIKEVTETDVTEDTDQSIATETMDTTSKSSSVYSGYDTSEEKSNIKLKKKSSKADKSSSTASILKSSTSSKSKESSTDTYVCTCHIQSGSGEKNIEHNKIRCVCPCSYCPRCDTKKTPLVVPCPFITTCMKTEIPPKAPQNTERSCPCAKTVVNDTKIQNQRNGRANGTGENQKLLCDCYTSTSSTGYTSSSDSCGRMQRGDCNNMAKGNVRYAITKITEYGKFTTFEVMKSTRKVPKFMPKSLEGVFVLKHKS